MTYARFPGLSVLRETKKEAEKTIAERLKRTNVSTNDSELKVKLYSLLIFPHFCALIRFVNTRFL